MSLKLHYDGFDIFGLLFTEIGIITSSFNKIEFTRFSDLNQIIIPVYLLEAMKKPLYPNLYR